MIEAMKFVQGAVSTKNLIPEMKHFAIQGGHVRGFNGMLALSSPIDFDMDCAPQAVPLVKAIQNCDDVVSLGMTPAGRLRVKSGGFKAFIECLDLQGLPHQAPEGQEIVFDGEQMMLAIRSLSPFVGNDASRPWTNGILLRGQSAFATNNVCLAEYWIGTEVPFTINVPMPAIKEMQRVAEPPTHAQVCEHSITFHYADGRWIRTQLFSTDWPDLTPILDVDSTPIAVSSELFKGLGMLKPFLDDRGLVFFKDGQVRTTVEDELGAGFDVPGLHHEGVYAYKMLSLLDGIATTADFGRYPDPVTFYDGDRMRGVITGQQI